MCGVDKNSHIIQKPRIYNAVMINFCTAQYTDMFGSHKCDCGLTHEFSVRCLLAHGAFNDMTSFLSEITPLMSRVVMIYDDESLMQEVNSAIKRDYRTVCVKSGNDKRSLDLVSLPEDSKLIIAIGSAAAINGAKYKAYISDLNVVVAAKPDFGALTSVCVVSDGGEIVTYEVEKPIGYIFDLDIRLSGNDKAELFGMIAARLNTSFEYYAAALLSSHNYCPFIAGALTDIAAKTILCVSEMDRASPKLNEVLLTSALKLSLLASLGSFERSGEVQCGIVYEMIGDSGYSQGELQFVFASVLSLLFKSHIVHRESFVPPPDNNYRSEQISELLRISEYKAFDSICPQISGSEAAIIEYKIKEYSFDLLEKLNKNINLYRPAFKIFKRLHSDDGYSLEDLCNYDIPLSISLAPDIISGNGMLTTLKKLGELDRYSL